MSHMALRLLVVVYFSSFSSLWDLTSSFIFFCVHWPAFFASLFCPPLFHSVQKRKSSSSVYLMVRSVPCLSPFSDSPSTLSHSLALFFSWLRCSRVCLGLFFCLIVGFCESWDHQTLTESCSPVQLCFITYTRSYWNPILLEVHCSFPLHLGAFFVTQTRAFV